MLKSVYYINKIVQKLNFIRGYIYLKCKYIYINKDGQADIIHKVIQGQDKKMDLYLSPDFSTLTYDRKSRIPKDIEGIKTKSVLKNARFDAGKRISFYTDSNILFLDILYEDKAILNNMNEISTSGIVVKITSIAYEKKIIVYPLRETQMHIRRKIRLDENIKEKFIRIYLPGYARIKKIIFGLQKGSSLKRHYYNKKPIVFYGSSITQGCAAQDASSNYVNIVGDHYKVPVLNFGFSESAKGETSIIQYIADREASLFVIEYDHNVTVHELRESHLNIYKTIRKFQPSTPVIFMSRLSGGVSISRKEEEERINIIENTISYAKDQADNRVAFLCGKDLLAEKIFKDYFVDDRHPNTAGMKLIAQNIGDIIDQKGFL